MARRPFPLAADPRSRVGSLPGVEDKFEFLAHSGARDLYVLKFPASQVAHIFQYGRKSGRWWVNAEEAPSSRPLLTGKLAAWLGPLAP